MRNSRAHKLFRRALLVCCFTQAALCIADAATDELASAFLNPPATARPWVYWFWMDGNSSREGITADFEAMARAGIGGVYQMEVDVGIPRGPVPFMSPKWRELFNHAVHEADRVGLQITVNAGPGWTGSGGPWVKPEQSMQKLVFSDTIASGGRTIVASLPQPASVAGFYRDVAVLAFPTLSGTYRISNIDEKALYDRGHYSSEAGVRSYLPEPAADARATSADVISLDSVIDVTRQMDSSGTLRWNAPPGCWTVMRFGHTSTGANTRPAPQAGLGLECDKMDRGALASHYENYVQPLIDAAGPLAGKSLANLHIDSWEMHTQNWTARFPEEFQRRRGYSIVPWLPVFSGRPIDSVEKSERFLWDLRRTCEELIVENHAQALKELGRKSAMHLSIEPYDGTPISDLRLGSVADIPMCEFWSNCFHTEYSCFEATSIAHTYGRSIVAAEAFTANDAERWLFYPGSMKTLGDWAFCRGINRFSFHRYAHQPWLDRAPGMTMGPYGIHYERTQTWWDMVDEYNRYIARCQAVLQQGVAVADVLYLAPEDSPFVFHPPSDAVEGDPPVPRSFHFDCCTADAIIKDGAIRTERGNRPRIAFKNGSSYAVLVLPRRNSMSRELLARLKQLVSDGGTVIGNAPSFAPGLSGYQESDHEVRRISDQMWQHLDGSKSSEIHYGKGAIVPDSESTDVATLRLPDVADVLANARWIWSADQPNAAHTAATGTRYFWHDLDLRSSSGAYLQSAHFIASADNAFELFVDGKTAGEHRDFRVAGVFDITAKIRGTSTRLLVVARNSGEKPNPAGFIGTAFVRYTDGSSKTFPTDAGWFASDTDPSGSLPASPTAAIELGAYGMAPWGQVADVFMEPSLYPTASFIEGVLTRFGIFRDVDQSLDYIHRRLDDADIYFVSNPRNEWHTRICTFNGATGTPEVWDAVTGQRGTPLFYTSTASGADVEISIEPRGSRFIVFRPRPDSEIKTRSDLHMDFAGSDGTTWTAENAIPSRDAVTSGNYVVSWQPNILRLVASTDPAKHAPGTVVCSAWEVRFQSQRGAPDSIQLDSLVDLSEHQDTAVRHFSGIATYSTRFDLPSYLFSDRSVLQLDLGDVAVMARVRLNGKLLRTLWKAPYTIEVTSAIRTGDNDLEVEVANLWPNRLIGDSALPDDQRIARTTWNPFKPDDPLPKSGLIGPVIIRPGVLVPLSKSNN